MKQPDTMTTDQIFKWLDKTSNTLYNAVYAGNRQRKQDAGDRYADLTEEAKQRGIWEGYCNDRNICPSHDQYDIC